VVWSQEKEKVRRRGWNIQTGYLILKVLPSSIEQFRIIGINTTLDLFPQVSYLFTPVGRPLFGPRCV